MTQTRRVEDVVDAEGWIIEGGYTAWDCDCGNEVRRYRGQGDVSCGGCDQPYNAFGQRLRADYRGNPSNYDDEIGDMEGFELQHCGDE